jgi:hypothetical protein
MTDDHMADENRLSFFARLSIAFSAFFRALGDPSFAAAVRRAASATAEQPLRTADEDAALQLLALLQREGRFVDFLNENIDAFSDADVGAAARVVHQGCRKAVGEHVTLEPVRSEAEGAAIVVPTGFDAAELHLVGNVTGQPPFRGTLQHRGWRVREVHLPRLAPGHDVRIVAPAEVEL